MVLFVFILIGVFTAFAFMFAVASLREREYRAGSMGLALAILMAAGLVAYGWAWRDGLLSQGTPHTLVVVLGVAMTGGTVSCFLPIGRSAKALQGTKGMLAGQPERLNQKDTAWNMAHVGAFGPEASKQRWALQSRDPFGGLLWTLCMQLRHQVEGKVNPQKLEGPTPEQFTKMVKENARYLGADLVGVTTVKQDFIYSEAFSYEESKLGENKPVTKPFEQKHKYIICLAREMDIGRIHNTLSPDKSLECLGEIGKTYHDLAWISCSLAAYIRGLGYSARAHHVRNEQVFHVPHAVDAGLGEQARNTYLLTKRFGPRVRLSSVTTDMPLVEDKPVDIGVQDFCDSCRLCENNCPAQALPAERAVVRGYCRWPQEQEKCFNFWVTGGNTFGCTLCIKICPWNKPRALVHRVASEAASRSIIARRLLYWMTLAFYGKRFRWHRTPLLENVELPPETKNWGK